MTMVQVCWFNPALRVASATVVMLCVGLCPSLRAQDSKTAVAPSAQSSAALSLTPELSRIFAGGKPASLAEFQAMESHVQALLKKILPCTVSVGGASAVIVQDGYVLCAGHVTRKPGRDITLTMHDGRKIKSKSLGLNTHTDSGILKITTKGSFPGLEMGDSKALKKGEWVVMLGFPGGRKEGLDPPLRLGRVIRLVGRSNKYLTTDCTMSAGDSGGPLFDMHGRVLGTNSRISRNLEENMHVPIEAFHREWEWLVKGKSLSSGRPPEAGWLGLIGNREAGKALVSKVLSGSPSALAGIEVGDEIRFFGERKVRTSLSIPRLAKRLWPGDKVKVTLKRNGKTLVKTVTVGKVPAADTSKSKAGK
jgi:serine protease Do